MPIKIVSVTQLNKYLKEKLEQDRLLLNIWVKGEISNFKHHSSGHMYFTLKDQQSAIKAVMFKSFSYNLPFKPADGLSVLVRGSISVYLQSGQYQLIIEEIQPEGYGAISLAFEQLKNKLEKEGLFAPELKQRIPVLPGKIGIVTSPTSAAIKDILTVLFRRFPQAQVIISPTQVQGEQAPQQIVSAINNLTQIGTIDVIIIARGGGTLEELWAFNSEEVARAIRACSIPIITGIGHETDYTIADFVADVRAATPSAAAELVVPSMQDLSRLLSQLQSRLEYKIKTYLNQLSKNLHYLSNTNQFKNPYAAINMKRQHLDELEQKLISSIEKKLHAAQQQLGQTSEKLNLLSPLAVLSRGYSICRQPEDKQLITSGKGVKKGQLVELILKKDFLLCEVLEIKEEGNG